MSPVFIGLFFYLILVVSAFSAESLNAVPSSLNLALAPGQLATYRMEVVNLENSLLSVKCVFDSQWMFIFPSEFEILPGKTKSIWAIFFIRREENPQKEGKIEFWPMKGGKQATVRVASSASPIMSAAVKEKEAGTEELEKLKKEMKDKDQKIEELKKEVEKTKTDSNPEPLEIEEMKNPEDLEPLYNSLTQELKSEVERDEVKIFYLNGQKIFITIPSVFVSDEAYLDKKGLAILEKTGLVLEQEAFGKKIEIRGYADALLGKETKEKFPSSWHLSTARASAVAKILQWKIGINGKYLRVVGCSSYHSPDDKAIEGYLKRNRKIEIVVSAE